MAAAWSRAEHSQLVQLLGTMGGLEVELVSAILAITYSVGSLSHR